MSTGLRPGRALPYLALAALVASIIQVTLGGVVRVTGSGLGCPDWPLCDGRVIPVFERTALVEFSHRIVATVVGLLTLGVAVLAWRRYRDDSRIVIPGLVGAVLVLVAALLGAAVVLTELAWWVRLVHLGVAEGVVACMAVVTLVAWRTGRTPGPEAQPAGNRLDLLIPVSVVGAFIVILSGSYMVGYGAGSSCGTWPLCRGSLLPEGTAYMIHMAHRLLSAAVGVVLVGSVIMALRRSAHIRGLSPTAWLVIAALAGQILLGAWTVWAGFSIEMRAAHLAGATLLWAAVIGLATMYGMPMGLPLRRQTSGALSTEAGRAVP